jgi:hypothetical protein
VNIFAKNIFDCGNNKLIHTTPGDDRMVAHNNGIIINASISIWQEEMNGHQLLMQPHSTNPVDTTRHNNRMIVKESIRVAHNNGIIVRAFASQQEEMNGDQPSAQPRSVNPVDTRRNNDGMIANESISVQQEESIVTQTIVQPHSTIQHCQNELPNISIPQE